MLASGQLLSTSVRLLWFGVNDVICDLVDFTLQESTYISLHFHNLLYIFLGMLHRLLQLGLRLLAIIRIIMRLWFHNTLVLSIVLGVWVLVFVVAAVLTIPHYSRF